MLHPWAYDLDLVDFKYIINNDITFKIVKALKSQDAQSFWLSNFKCQSSVSADDFFGALSEVCQINKIGDAFQARLPQYQAWAHGNNFVLSLASNASDIDQIVREIV